MAACGSSKRIVPFGKCKLLPNVREEVVEWMTL